MIEAIIAEMGPSFRKGVFSSKTSYCFCVGEETVTVVLDAESFSLVKGKAADSADCSCRTSEQMFKKIWCDGYKPGIMDFLGGAIKCDAPLMLPQFLKAFGKELP